MNRKGFIGGSDCAKIMSGNWHDLWLVKTGQKEPDDLSFNHPVQIGILTEPYNLFVFQQEYDVELENYQKEYTMNWNGVPLKGTIDASVVGMQAIVEAKHTSSFNKLNIQIDRYTPQIQFYLWLSNTSLCYFPNFFGNGNSWRCGVIEKDGEYIDRLKNILPRFWSHVINNVEPKEGIHNVE